MVFCVVWGYRTPSGFSLLLSHSIGIVLSHSIGCAIAFHRASRLRYRIPSWRTPRWRPSFLGTVVYGGKGIDAWHRQCPDSLAAAARAPAVRRSLKATRLGDGVLCRLGLSHSIGLLAFAIAFHRDCAIAFHRASRLRYRIPSMAAAAAGASDMNKMMRGMSVEPTWTAPSSPSPRSRAGTAKAG